MLSLKKLEELLYTENCSLKRVYAYRGSCMFLEVANYNSHDVFLLYIPSKYDIPAKGYPNVYHIKEFEGVDKNQVEGMYNTIDLDIDLDDEDNLKQNLEDKYKKELNLDINDEDLSEIDNIKEQVDRIRHCIKNTEYKVAIEFKKYIVCLRRNDDVDAFVIQDVKDSEVLKLLIVTDLEMFYNKPKKTLSDISVIQKGIITLIEDMKKSHEKIFEQLITKEKGVNNKLKQIDIRAKLYDSEISKLSELLQRVNGIDVNIREEYSKLKKKYRGTSNLNSDIQYSHIRNKYDNELKKIMKIKQRLVNSIIVIKNYRYNTYLHIDKLLFENNVLLNTVINNMKKISKYA